MRQLFSILKGLRIRNTPQQQGVDLLTGTTVPGGDGDSQDQAGLGSLYLRSAIGLADRVYVKNTNTNSTQDWSQLASVEYVQQHVSGVTWREPALALDETAYADSSEFLTTGEVDGVILMDGDRVLFINAGNDSNVWIWDAVNSLWVEDDNGASDGDTLFIQQGSYEDQQWLYNGTNWQLQVTNGSGSTQTFYNNVELSNRVDFVYTGVTDSAGKFTINTQVYTHVSEIIYMEPMQTMLLGNETPDQRLLTVHVEQLDLGGVVTGYATILRNSTSLIGTNTKVLVPPPIGTPVTIKLIGR